MDIKKELLGIMRSLVRSKKFGDEELFSVDYVDKGLIDSFQIVELITKLESHFGIKFSSEDFTSEEFKTLKGISTLIEGRIKK
jgi:acyl carrier protein